MSSGAYLSTINAINTDALDKETQQKSTTWTDYIHILYISTKRSHESIKVSNSKPKQEREKNSGTVRIRLETRREMTTEIGRWTKICRERERERERVESENGVTCKENQLRSSPDSKCLFFNSYN